MDGGDPFAGLDAKYGIGAGAPPPAPATATAPPPSSPPAAGAADPYAALDAKYFAGSGTEQRTPAEQRSDTYYGKQSTGSDIQQSSEAAVPKLVAGVIGLPRSIASLRDAATAWSLKKAGYSDEQVAQMMHHLTQLDVIGNALPSAGDVQKGLEKVSGGAPIYEPQTGAGEIAGRATQNLLAMGKSVPAAIGATVLGEAGKRVGGTPGDIIGSLLGAGLGSLAESLARSNMPNSTISDALKNVSDDQLKQADQLVKDSIAKGTPITGPEAIAQVTGGNVKLTDMQRVLERTPEGQAKLGPMMGGRAQANQGAMQTELGNIAPGGTPTTEIAPKVQTAAEGAVNQTRQNINDMAKPFYQAAESQTVEPSLFASLQSNPMFQAALKQVRKDPAFGNLQGLPDNSIAVVDAVKKQLGETASGFAPNIAQAGSKTREAAYIGAKEQTQAAARASSPDYNMAQGVESSMREQFLDPLKRSITGKLAAAEQFPEQAKLLLKAPLTAGTEVEISNAVSSVASRNPEAASQLVRAMLEDTFNGINKDLSSGVGKQFGGARFANTVAGGTQQAANLRAAIEALPNGTEGAKSFESLLRIFKAQGERSMPGSMTSFNSADLASLGKAGVLGETAMKATSPREWLALGRNIGQDMMVKRNAARLAEIFTSPDSVEQMRQIAKIAPDSAKARALYSLLISPVPAASEGNQQKQ